MTIRIPDISGLKDGMKERVKDALQEQMQKIQVTVTTKTQSGVDADGAPFAKYSESYEAFKRRKLGQSGEPNLRLTGDMLGSLQTEITESGSEITGKVKVTGDFNQQKARWNQGQGRAPARKFMGIDSETRRNLIDAIKEGIIKGR